MQVVSSDVAYVGRGQFNPDYEIIGKIDRDMPNMLIKANQEGKKTKFIDDTCNLTKKTKGELVDFFKNEKTPRGKLRQKAYIVRLKKRG